MTLKSIELVGFKSFGKKHSLSFSNPVICIVGPNGSGKSNIVEAFRFVLGEQSMKSLRGKGGVDLIFKGSKNLASSNRASVNITFDNSNKIFSFTNSGIGISLDYDEITVGREVFTDGANRYSINGTEVRLKDVVDLLASVNIGSSGHHIISQGEADRVLNASNKDRRSMIEDSLGLKIYQFRIKESERKLDKTIINMKEVQTLRREIAPHLSFLKKQVEKIEKAREMRDNLQELYKTYLSAESTYINTETNRLMKNKSELTSKSLSLDKEIENLKNFKSEDLSQSENIKIINENENNLRVLHTKKDELVRSLGRIEGIIEGIEKQFAQIPKTEERVISETEWKSLISTLERQIDEAILLEDLPSVINILKNIKLKFRDFKGDTSSILSEVKILTEDSEYIKMQETKNDFSLQIDDIKEKETNLVNLINEYKEKEKESQYTLRNNEHNLYELLRVKNEVTSSLHKVSFEEEKISQIKNYFEMELTEGGILIGREVISYSQIKVLGDIDRTNQEELRRKIERIKIKLEDSGSGDASLIMKEFDDTRDRDVFLSNELEDLNKSIEALRLLIQELKETLDKEFNSGVEKINKQFQEFFSLMFGGGSAFLSIVMEHKKKRKIDDEALLEEEGNENDEEEENNDIGFERGIEINVTLPQKKVKDLHMLSGGERSLTSIALLFAISQVNPPPFLVLDETDAALDESNSRKYGNMLENLSKYSQLIVVTHNRETMSRAQVLYGVTMSSLGASTLLSIRLEDAKTYAK